MLEPATMIAAEFIDRRQSDSRSMPTRERRQFCDGRVELSLEARELAMAIDQYKLQHRRRFITFEEMLTVLTELGYHK